jgi:hypothetical protein
MRTGRTQFLFDMIISLAGGATEKGAIYQDRVESKIWLKA